MATNNIGYCANAECMIIQQALVKCKDPECPEKDKEEHYHCKKCHELLIIIEKSTES